ncbi:desmoglein-2-like protein [Corythoichthys intestinalis]|uniref:desmoglein-2-like protein n=1 Tax=Corythoichthys intestinalis TaxID=161448 RepID=UPI0025A573BD|nr:desmoglein-2-like protein [Corythoichthys intestinalis]XP_061795626.1 desmoglein-2-like protein [Nerophis lumbriciformis]
MAPLWRCTILGLLCCFTLVPVWAEGNGLHRQKRDWIRHPRQLKENHDYSGINIGRIRSDKENFTRILYSLRGPGADEPPVRVFGVDAITGFLKVYKVLDREEIAFYDLKGVAKYEDGTRAEKDVDIRITVVDENDNTPIIKANQVGSVNESCAAGTVVMRVIATDADQENTLASQMFYSIVETSSSAGMFFINSQTGEVTVLQNTLDRETKDTYKVVVKASDLNGQAGGNVGMGEIVIKLLDINDNVPTLEKESYEGSVEENTINVEVLRIQAIDLDLQYTDNWLAVFQIISGNEGGYFHITTDAKTNQGIIMIQKELDYEEIKSLNLGVVVSNKAKYDFGSSSSSSSVISKSYSVKVNVINQKEGPRFQPSVKVVTLSEDHTSIFINKVITTYAAIDSDTQLIATNVRYAKFRDDDNWLIIDERTAEIRLNKLPDRESKFLINGTYYAQIICISEEITSKTATGTIAIQVEDFNDHCPIVTTTSHTMCYGENVLFITAVDKDEFPNSAPFDFTVISASSHGKWSVEHFNATTAILRDQEHLWPGMYKLAVEIKDQQGVSCADVQMLDVVVCTCEETTKTCVSRIERRSDFGVAGILFLLLGLLLLLLVPLLLLFCLCGGTGGDFKAIPFETKQQLISYHTECQGEDREVPLLHTPDAGQVTISRDINTLGGKSYIGGLAESGGAVIGGNENSVLTTDNVHMYNEYNQFSGQGRINVVDGGMMTGQGQFSQYRGGAWDDLALSDHFLEEYYSSKSNHAAQQSQEKDALLVYDYEGGESLSGSVGCCSLHENDNDLSFLDDLDPKFKTLAEICSGSVQVDAGICVHPPARPVSPIRPSIQKNIQTHTETFRDRDRVHIDTLNTSKATSGASTFVQEGSSTLSKVHIQENVVIPGQTLLVQQPLYYAAAPMYVVEPQSQMVLVGAQQGVGQVGLTQGLVQVSQQGAGQVGLTQGLVQVSGLQGSQGVVLVDGQVGHVAQGSLPRQVLVVENGATSGGQGAPVALIQSGQGSSAQATLQKQVLVVEKGASAGGAQVAIAQTGQGTSEQRLDVRGQRVQTKSFSRASQDSTGSKENFALKATPKTQVGQRVVVHQHKKVSVTERNMESTSRA